MDNNNFKPMRNQQLQPIAIDFGKLWNLVVLKWYWFVVSVMACVILAGVYLWYTPITIAVNGKMQIIDRSKQSSGISAGMALLNNLPMGLGSAIGGSLGGGMGTDSEIEILKSTSLVRDVVNELNLHTEYKLCRWGKKTMLYKDRPVNVTLDPAHLQWLDDELPLFYHEIRLTLIKNADGYTVETTLKENKDETDYPDQTFASLPANVKTEYGTLTITPNDSLTEKQLKRFENGYKLKITIMPPMSTANAFISRLNAETPSKKATNMLNIVLRDENVLRGIDFINHLIVAYNDRANEDKNEEARKTDEFVTARLAKIDSELGTSDAAWESSKKNYQITDPSVDAAEVVEKKSKYEAQLVEIGTQIQLHDYLSEYIDNPENLYEIIPVGLTASMGGSEAASETPSSNSSLISRHNSLVNQRKELLRSMSEKSPQVQRLSESLQELHPTLKMAMKRDRQNLLMKRSNVEREYSKYMGKVSTAPQMERVLTEIGRQREIKQGVYLLMLQKREETAMELANTTDKGKLIDVIQQVPGSNTPKKSVVLVVAVILGILLALGMMVLLQMLYSKIDSKDDLKSITKRPVLGGIPMVNSEEAIRSLRTNLLLHLKESKKIIIVASHAEGDGKTFLAKQLVDSLNAIDKKAFYLNADLRGVGGGKSPADILASADFAQQIAQAKAENDYVIIDTPALGSYTDACQVAQYADATLFVVKSESTEKSLVEAYNDDTRLPNMMYVINALDMTKKKIKQCYKNAFMILMSLVLFSSCMSTSNVPYFKNKEDVNLALSKGLYDAKIMPKDILRIQVFTMTAEAADQFNLQKSTSLQSSSYSSTSENSVYNYLVDNDGNIYFPVIGNIHLGGMTKNEAESYIKSKIAPYMSDSEDYFVHVRMMNYKYSVIGEVNKPGLFTTQNEKVNIIEAIAQAGDLTLYGLRDKVFVIREDATGQKEYHQLNLNDANIISSPYYYLQQNDIVYVEPNKSKARSSYFTTSTSMWFSLTSSLMSITTFIIALSK